LIRFSITIFQKFAWQDAPMDVLGLRLKTLALLDM